jgi:hypothetical protein
VKSGDTAGDFAAHRNPLWSDHAARPLIADFANDVAVETSHSELSSLPPALTLGAESFGLRARNLHTGVVTVRPRNIPQLPPFDAIDLEIRRHQVLLVDSWAAGGPAEVSRRIADDGLLVYPIAPLKALGDTLGQLPALVLDPAMAVGKLEPDIVPCDRLESGC